MDYLTNIRWTNQSDSGIVASSTRRNYRMAPRLAANGSGLPERRLQMYDALGLHNPHSRLAPLGAAITRALLWPARVIEARRTMNQLAGRSQPPAA